MKIRYCKKKNFIQVSLFRCLTTVVCLLTLLSMTDPYVRELVRARVPTAEGEFVLHYFENSEDDEEHVALVMGKPRQQSDVLVRVHSECFTGDVLGSLRCDCGDQLQAAKQMIAEHGSGILLYLRQEGRGIGLLDKLKAYNLQDEGYDTVEANIALGHEADERDYTVAGLILRHLGVDSIRLITNNPDKVESLRRFGVNVTERVSVPPHLNAQNKEYLRTKAERMRHLLGLGS